MPVGDDQTSGKIDFICEEDRLMTDRQQVVDTVVKVFDAVKARDRVAFDAVLQDDFLLHENGQCLDADGIFKLIVAAQDAGTEFEWNIIEPLVHIDGNLASLAYRNRGAVTQDGVRQPLEWLETATLLRGTHGWRIAFMSSMRDARFTSPSTV
jgi:hypothetical protein